MKDCRHIRVAIKAINKISTNPQARKPPTASAIDITYPNTLTKSLLTPHIRA